MRGFAKQTGVYALVGEGFGKVHRSVALKLLKKDSWGQEESRNPFTLLFVVNPAKL